VSASLNWIPEEQNSPWALDRVAAKSALYDRVRALATLQVFLAVVVPVVVTVLAVPFPALTSWGGLYGIAMAFAEPFGLERLQRGFRELAAKVQEEFDCHLFQLEWREGRVGPRPRPEDVQEWAKRHLSRATPADRGRREAMLRDWYPAAVGRLPLAAARLVCQRANGVWDSRMRVRYAGKLLALLLTAAAVVVIAGLATDAKLGEWAVRAAMLAPLFGWAIREYLAQQAAGEDRQRVQERADAIWKHALKTTPDDLQLTQDARELQNDLYDQRMKSPAVFHWVYERFRDEDEAAMQCGAEALVAEYERAHGLSAGGAVPTHGADRIGEGLTPVPGALPRLSPSVAKKVLGPLGVNK